MLEVEFIILAGASEWDLRCRYPWERNNGPKLLFVKTEKYSIPPPKPLIPMFSFVAIVGLRNNISVQSPLYVGLCIDRTAQLTSFIYLLLSSTTLSSSHPRAPFIQCRRDFQHQSLFQQETIIWQLLSSYM